MSFATPSKPEGEAAARRKSGEATLLMLRAIALALRERRRRGGPSGTDVFMAASIISKCRL
jgi:hypothetical protein